MSNYVRVVLPYKIGSNGDLEIVHPQGILSIRKNVQLARAVLEISDGTLSRDEICQTIAFKGQASVAFVVRILDRLVELKVLQAPESFHETQLAAELNPSHNHPNRSKKEIEEQRIRRNLVPASRQVRNSCRNFDLDFILDIREVADILRECYSLKLRPFASAGGLYPCQVTILKRRSEGFMVHSWNPNSELFITQDELLDDRSVSFAFDSVNGLYGASAIAIIGADLSIHTYKYGPRGYRFTLLEVGQLSQLIVDRARERGLASLQYGGFMDNELRKLLGWMGDSWPIISLAIGKEDSTRNVDNVAWSNALTTAYCVEAPRVSLPRLLDANEYGGISRVRTAVANVLAARNHHEIYGAGASTSSLLAEIAAIAEGVERSTCGESRVDIECPAIELDVGWLDVRQAFPLSDEYLSAATNIVKFDPRVKMQWVVGHRTKDMTPVAIPIDAVYYPLSGEDFGRPLVAYANSSGVAAARTTQEASKRALLELVERDALMRMWSGKTLPMRIDTDNLDAISAIDRWHDEGRLLEFWHLEAKSPTILATLRSKDFPGFVCGAGSALQIEDALVKALNELEGSASMIGKSQLERANDLQNIRRPGDHARYYHDPENAKKLHAVFDMRSHKKVDFNHLPKIAIFEELVMDCDPIQIEMSSSNEPLSVVRVLSENLVPIWFGVSSHYGGHKSLAPIDYREMSWNPLGQPHFFP